MKILLLTDIPPCKTTTGGLFLDQLCRLLPKGSIACFAVVSPGLDARISPDLNWIPIEYHKKPRENSITALPRQLRGFPPLATESYNSLVKTRRIAESAIQFGRKFGADAVWCLLEGQTMIRLALPVSKGLGVPLLTQVVDPPSWWVRAYGLDKISGARVLQDFDRAIRASTRCAAVSWAMAEQYGHDYNTKMVTIVPSLDARYSIPPAKRTHPGEDFVIGMAGQTYAGEEWRTLISALNSIGWRISGRKIKIRLLGREIHLSANSGMRVEFLGWNPQEEVIRLLSKVDVLYCPYWFDPKYEVEARLSFPSKLTTYLAAGCPILFHGPEYASPGRFLQEHDAAIFCRSLDKNDVVATLTRLATDEGLYSQLTRNGHTAFTEHLTFASQRKNFAEFLQVNEEWLAPAGEQG